LIISCALDTESIERVISSPLTAQYFDTGRLSLYNLFAEEVGHKLEGSSTPLKISRTIFPGWPASIVSSLLPDSGSFEVILHPNSPNSVHASIRVENEHHEFSVTDARDASRSFGLCTYCVAPSNMDPLFCQRPHIHNIPLILYLFKLLFPRAYDAFLNTKM
jgi:hypothetical protein